VTACEKCGNPTVFCSCWTPVEMFAAFALAFWWAATFAKSYGLLH
jgi:hypothetical protein